MAVSITWSVEQGNEMPLSWSGNEKILQDLAHDLRQPLGDIEMIAYDLQTRAGVDPAQARDMLGKIRLLVEQANDILSRSLREPLSGLPVPPSGV